MHKPEARHPALTPAQFPARLNSHRSIVLAARTNKCGVIAIRLALNRRNTDCNPPLSIIIKRCAKERAL
jgi:hypothetical protein